MRSPGLPDAAGPLCLGLGAVTTALEAAATRQDFAGMLLLDADLRGIAARLAKGATPGIADAQVLDVLMAARRAVREAQSMVERAKGQLEADQRQSRKLWLAYGGGAR